MKKIINIFRYLQEEKNNEKIIALVVLVLAVAGGVFFLLNQNSGPEKQIIGTWYDSKHDSTIVFNSDKTLEVTNNKDESRDGTWKIAGKYVKLKVSSAASAKAELPGKDEKEVKYLKIQFNSIETVNSDFRVADGTFEKQ